MTISPINFRQIEASDLDVKGDPSLANLNAKFKEVVDRVNALMGVHGPISLLSDIDMKGKRIMNLGPAQVTSDALAQSSADPLYGQKVQQSNMEAVGSHMLQTARRLNDGTQQHQISSDLNAQGSIPPTFVGTMNYASTPTSITWTWTNLQIRFADSSIVAIPNGSQACTGLASSNTYFFYPYYDTNLGTVIFVADSVNAFGAPPIAFAAPTGAASIAQHNDGRVPLSQGGVPASTPASGSGGGSGGGFPVCIFGGMCVMSREGVVPLRQVKIGDELLSRNGLWTKIVTKRTGPERSWVKIALSNREAIIVTVFDRLPLFGGDVKRAGLLCLEDVLRGTGQAVEEIPLQITELSPLLMSGDWVLIGCEPIHEFVIGSMRPSVFVHNSILKP